MAPSSLTTRASRLLNWRPISAKKCYSLINNHHYKLQGAFGLCSVCLQIRKWPNQLCSTFKWCFRQFQTGVWGSEQPNIPKPCPVALKIWTRRNTPEHAGTCHRPRCLSGSSKQTPSRCRRLETWLMVFFDASGCDTLWYRVLFLENLQRSMTASPKSGEIRESNHA